MSVEEKMLIVALRTIILYVLIIFALRLMGKKQLGELQPSELVTTILVSNIATLSLEDPSLPMLMGIIPIVVIVCLDVILSAIMMKSGKIRRVVTGTPRIIIADGKIDQPEMKNLRYTIDDVAEAMREQSIFDLNNVRYAIVETNGSINFFEKEHKDSPDINPPAFLIKDGEIDDRGIKEARLSREWLEEKLRKEHLHADEVFIFCADELGNYNVVRKSGGKGK